MLMKGSGLLSVPGDPNEGFVWCNYIEKGLLSYVRSRVGLRDKLEKKLGTIAVICLFQELSGFK